MDTSRYKEFIEKELDDEEYLGAILIKLQNMGMEYEEARILVRDMALQHSRDISLQAVRSMSIGVVGFVLLITVGYVSAIEQVYYYSFGSLAVGSFQYFKSRKRLNYLRTVK
jgi:hypothetical protein